MKVLYYDNRKIDPILWDASTPEKEDAAFLALFHVLDEDWECYHDLDEREGYLNLTDWRRQRERREKAKKGDSEAAKALLQARQDNEYESWYLFKVTDPNE